MKLLAASTLPLLLALLVCLLLSQETGVMALQAVEKPSKGTDEAAETTAAEATGSDDANEETAPVEEEAIGESQEVAPVQSGPMIDMFGEHLYSFQFLDESTGKINPHYTNDALAGKKVIGLYFSADWCGPCRQFTPELVSFYERMNKKRGKKDQFEIVWISRCRDGNSYAQYFSHMPWLALPPEEAMGARGQQLGDKYKVKSIPALVLIDDLGNTITLDARTKIPKDKAGIGFPWRDPLSQLVHTFIPRSLRSLIRSQIQSLKWAVINKLKSLIGLRPKAATAQ